MPAAFLPVYVATLPRTTFLTDEQKPKLQDSSSEVGAPQDTAPSTAESPTALELFNHVLAAAGLAAADGDEEQSTQHLQYRQDAAICRESSSFEPDLATMLRCSAHCGKQTTPQMQPQGCR